MYFVYWDALVVDASVLPFWELTFAFVTNGSLARHKEQVATYWKAGELTVLGTLNSFVLKHPHKIHEIHSKSSPHLLWTVSCHCRSEHRLDASSRYV